MSDPLAGLDDVHWTSLHHAYGAATDTPGLLRRLAAHDIDDDVWERLFSSLAHQGTVYEASAAAAPFLIALTHVVGGTELVPVLEMLWCIAAGSAVDEATSARCIEAAAQGFARYVELLVDCEPAVREMAAKLIASYPDRARGVRLLFEEALDTEADDAVRTVLLESYDAFVDLKAEGARARLWALAADPDGAVAAWAAFILVKRAEQTLGHTWLDTIVREATSPLRAPSPVSNSAALDLRDVLRDVPVFHRLALLDSLLNRTAAVTNSYRAFQVGESLLWLAFNARLRGSARPPNPFVFVDSLAFPMPASTGGGAPETMERPLGGLHWRESGDRPQGVEWIRSPYVNTWDFPQPGYWTVPPHHVGLPGVTIAEPVAPVTLLGDERRVLRNLARWDPFWRTESDLLMVYGLPVRRQDLAALAGDGEP
jgi:hypothetical protein